MRGEKDTGPLARRSAPADPHEAAPASPARLCGLGGSTHLFIKPFAAPGARARGFATRVHTDLAVLAPQPQTLAACKSKHA